MELLQLRYFCALARNQHLTRTAEQLMISAPSLSATISKLEKSLGVKLFDRNGRNICLNRYGIAFYERANFILRELDNAERELQDMKVDDISTVRVGISSLPIWQNALDEVQNQFPNIVIDYFAMSPFELSEPEKASRSDLFLGVSRDIPQELYCVKEVRRPEKPVAVVSRKHPLAGERAVSLLQCREDVILSLGKYNPSAHKYIMDLCSAAGFSPRKVIEVDHYFRIKMLHDNRGIALTTDLGAEFIYSDPQKVCVVPVCEPNITRIQTVAWRKDGFLSHAEKTFIDYLADYYRED